MQGAPIVKIIDSVIAFYRKKESPAFGGLEIIRYIGPGLLVTAAFHDNGINVTELQQAKTTLEPVVGRASSIVFAGALVLAGFSSSITAAMAGGSIVAGMFRGPFNVADRHSRTGILVTVPGALAVILLPGDPFRVLIWSQIALSVQLPWTVFGLIGLTSSAKVMGEFKNSLADRAILGIIAVIVSALNVLLFLDVTGIWKI